MTHGVRKKQRKKELNYGNETTDLGGIIRNREGGIMVAQSEAI